MGRLHRILIAVLFCLAHPAQSETGFSGDKALDHIVNQIAFGPRSLDNPEGKQQTLAYIEQTLTPLADKLVRQSFNYQGLTGTNLWASIESSNKKTSSARIMLGAHWDTRPLQSNHKGLVNLGANDGASGVAVLLELARILALSPPNVSVDFIFFDLEDMGHINYLPYAIGSKEFVKNNPEYRPSAGIIIDMVCDKSLSIPREKYSQNRAKEIVDQVWKIASSLGVKAFKRSSGTFITDDHLAFLDVGIPVIDIIHYPFPHYWHTSRDTLSNCSAESLGQVGQVVSEFIYSQR